MSDVLNNAAIDRLARWILGLAGAAPTLQLRLYSTNVVPTPTTVEADFTEVSAPGYRPVNFAPGNWTGSTVAGIAVYNYPVIAIAFTGPGSPGQTVFGSWVRDSATGQVLWARLWDAPYTIPPPGGTIYVTPTWQDRQC
ncbi:MAG: hypothetical protein ACRDQ6_05505 [Pseudonocardiaceae bacterium]